MNHIVVDNEQLSYIEEGNGETVVLIHGFCGSVDYWEYIIPLLSEKYHVIAVDLRGHGSSTYSGEPFEIEDLAKDINRLLKKLEIEKVYMFGHSLGGYVTLAFAELFAEHLKGFGLVHSTAYSDTEEGKEGRLNAIRKIQNLGIKEFVNGLIPNLFADESLMNLPDEVEKAKKIGYQTDGIAAMETQAAMRKRPDRNGVVEQAKIPVLLIKGTKDKVVSLDRVTSASNRNVSEVQLETGHMSMQEAPEKLANAIHSFISSNSK
ncbi:alpha/beta fold hydrolase [Niallia circulans]|jgi:3-oxoadipate enol-lactonase|uniref:alpha/beta fold hydrolase n=1 Tax=Niallia circulans TaxID=1397 RepID=UPI0011A58BE1